MTRGELVTRVGQKLGLAYDIAGDEQTLLQDLCNEAVVKVLQRTHVYTRIGTMTLTDGYSEYRLDSDVLAIADGKGDTPAGIGHYKLIPLEEMIRRQAVSAGGSSWQKAIAMEGNLMFVSPTPSSGEALTFYYVPRPTLMTVDSYDPSNILYGGIPTEHHDAIEYYMLWQGAEYDDKEHALTPKDYHDIYVSLCNDIRKHKRQLRGRILLEPQIGYPSSRRSLSSRNDVYPS